MSWKSSDWLANGLIFNMFLHCSQDMFLLILRPQSLGMCPGMLQKLSVEELKVTQTLKFGGLCLP